MITYKPGLTLNESQLQPYDPVEGGAVSIEGDINPRVRIDFEAGPVVSGLFTMDPGTVEIVWPLTEHAFVLEGRVTITYHANGESVTYNVGDGWIIRKGERVTWKVADGRFIKSFFMVAEEPQ